MGDPMTSTTDETDMGEVSPALLIDAMFAFRKTAAIKAAIEIDLFTSIGGEGATIQSLASKSGGAERGLRILCDYLTVHGFLIKTADRYSLTPSSQTFLDRHSPAYMGAAIEFLAAPEMVGLFLDDPLAYVRNGGAVGLANIAPDNPVWVKFARGMGSFIASSAGSLAVEVAGWPKPPTKVLDIAAGHGRFGIEIAKAVPSAEIVAVDWKAVLELAQQNAKESGVAARYRVVPGSAFDVDWGGDYDLVLLPNFLHHFDIATCAGLLRKIRTSLSDEGKVIAVDFVPNEDRVTPPFPAAFPWEMLASTPKGDAYTQKELSDMAQRAGFSGVSVKSLPPSPASLILFER
jgi:SAM-dependent methyltransferase